MTATLTPHQTAVATAFLADQARERRHLVVALSGAHAYGFPSPDSDLDLKAVHVEPTRELLALEPRSRHRELLTVIDGVEVDYTSNEVQFVLRGVVGGNGNFIERLLGRLQPVVATELVGLRPLVTAVLSRRVYRHYQGFARQQHREWEATGYTSAKRLLYVVRTVLTGVHLLRTGQLETDVTRLAEPCAVADVLALVEAKTKGEQAPLPTELSTLWRERTRHLFTKLDEARDASELPAEAPVKAVQALDAWLLELRRAQW
ncbi:MAG: nucleotidyltransferase domain-containing protein [Myxococcaceae bacterium]|nr:nucleotidyltransferase domain-containing protein [Myxococcaceae bacterium]